MPAEGLAFEGLAELQGPALLAYNDATFSEADYQSISSIGDSVKRAEASKTGRFGIGFNSVRDPSRAQTSCGCSR